MRALLLSLSLLFTAPGRCASARAVAFVSLLPTSPRLGARPKCGNLGPRSPPLLWPPPQAPRRGLCMEYAGDGDDRPVPPTYAEAGKGNVSCLLRYVVDGSKIARDGRLLPFSAPQQEAGAYGGDALLERLRREGVDLDAFKAYVYDEANQGWVRLGEGQTFDFTVRDSARVDVKLVPKWDKTISRAGQVQEEGFFYVGVFGLKHQTNLGTLWRSAYQMGACQIFQVGAKSFDKMASDVVRSWTNVPFVQYSEWGDLAGALPYATQLVAVEMGGEPLETFKHPKRAVYLLGSEAHGIPEAVVRMCHAHVALPSVRYESFNVAVAGSIVMYDRLAKLGGKAPEELEGLGDEMGGNGGDS